MLCTDIANTAEWRVARIVYGEVFDVLVEDIELDEYDAPKNLVSAARSTGYFYLCDYLRNNEDSLNRSKLAFQIALNRSIESNLTNRAEDLRLKLQIANLL